MLRVNQLPISSNQPTLQAWVHQAISNSFTKRVKSRLRLRLRGDNLHILCETSENVESKPIIETLVTAIQGQSEPLSLLTSHPEQKIARLIVYGRTSGKHEPDWLETIVLDEIRQLSPQSKETKTIPPEQEPEITDNPGFLVSNQSLARSGAPEAIARYLSDCFSHLGVNIQVLLQKLPSNSNSEQNEDKNQRLWVICTADYSPEVSLLATPIAQELRNLELVGLREAVIRGQVRGEAKPDWLFRVDLTPSQQMLEEWAHWGDVHAIARLLNRRLASIEAQIRAVLKEKTLYLFSSWLDVDTKDCPPQDQIIEIIAPILESLNPQGIDAATIYGIMAARSAKATWKFAHHQSKDSTLEEQPQWVHWLGLAGSKVPELSVSTWELAKQGNQDALNFLLHRMLNPDLDQRLNTGGIRSKICVKGNLLHIMAEAVNCPLETEVVLAIEKLFHQLNLKQFAGLRIYGRQAGQSVPLWHHRLDLIKGETVESAIAPEFAVTEGYGQDLEIPSEETESGEEVAILPTLGSKIRENLQLWLCATKIWERDVETDPNLVHSNITSSNLETSKSLKVALVWSAVGILLTLQVDWLLGQMLNRQMATTTETSALAAGTPLVSEAAPPPKINTEDVDLPQLSLQKSDFKPTQGFSENQFTTEGNNNIIFEESNQLQQKRSDASSAALLAVARSSNPTFNNRLLDEKLALYQQRLKERGPADIIIIGSSRAMRGVDPEALKQALIAQGYPELDIFNFGINGATAQVVDLILTQILTPDQLPKLVIFADGARAFNSGREDLTYGAIANSPGYQQLNNGSFPHNNQGHRRLNTSLMAAVAPSTSSDQSLTNFSKNLDSFLNYNLGRLSSVYNRKDQLNSQIQAQFSTWLQPLAQNTNPETKSEIPEIDEQAIDFDGFLPLSIRFDPDGYYQNHPQVSGAYDGDYANFELYGSQHEALINVTEFLTAHNVKLVIVNQPLTDRYLDPIRQKYEQQFQEYMQKISATSNVIFRDLVTQPQWQKQYDLFSDPSHLNRYGAYQVSQQLAKDAMINWSEISPK